MPTRSASLGNIAGQFSTWQQTIGNNLSTMGRTLGLQQSQQQNQAAILQALQQHSQSAQGQMQAIQAGNELAGANAAQLAQIQATLTATAQMQALGCRGRSRSAGHGRRCDAAFRTSYHRSPRPAISSAEAAHMLSVKASVAAAILAGTAAAICRRDLSRHQGDDAGVTVSCPHISRQPAALPGQTAPAARQLLSTKQGQTC